MSVHMYSIEVHHFEDNEDVDFVLYCIWIYTIMNFQFLFFILNLKKLLKELL